MREAQLLAAVALVLVLERTAFASEEPLNPATRALAKRVLATACRTGAEQTIARTCAIDDPTTDALRDALHSDLEHLASIDATKDIVPQLERLEEQGSVARGTGRAVRAVERLADAKSEDDVKRLARELVVPLPGWTDSLVAEVNGSMPVLRSDDLRIDGDLLLGWNARTWGIAGRGSVYDYERTRANGIDDTARYDGSLSGWGAFALGQHTHAQLRGVAGASLYDTTTASVASRTDFVDETSIIGRGELLGGLRHVPTDRIAVGVEAGGGLQVESWDGNAASTSGGRIQYVNTEQSPVQIRGSARARFEWRFVPEVVSFRARVDASYLSLSRSVVTTSGTTGIGGPSSVATVSSTEQLEVFARAFIGVDALRVFDLEPAVHAGINYVAVDGGGVVVPVFGAGIRHRPSSTVAHE